MSHRQHAICRGCWKSRTDIVEWVGARIPLADERCCLCGAAVDTGFYALVDTPDALICGGKS